MGEPIRVEFYYSIGSRYSYLASTQIARLERETGARVEWLPLSSLDLMAGAGYGPFRGSAPSGQYAWPYRRYDAECWADYYGVPYHEPDDPEVHPPNLACVAARRLGDAAGLSRQLFHAHFVEGRSPTDDAELITIARSVGLDSDRFAAHLHDPETVALHRTTVRQALDRGAFGVPTFIVGGRMFWGNDHLPLVRRAITKLQDR